MNEHYIIGCCLLALMDDPNNSTTRAELAMRIARLRNLPLQEIVEKLNRILRTPREASQQRGGQASYAAHCDAERIIMAEAYDPSFGDDRICLCGHTYYRHFDSHDGMAAGGCEYCECSEFTDL